MFSVCCVPLFPFRPELLWCVSFLKSIQHKNKPEPSLPDPGTWVSWKKIKQSNTLLLLYSKISNDGWCDEAREDAEDTEHTAVYSMRR